MNMDVFQSCTEDVARGRYPGVGERKREQVISCILRLHHAVGRLSHGVAEYNDGPYVVPTAARTHHLGECLFWLTRAADEMGLALDEVAECHIGNWVAEQMGGQYEQG